MSFTIKSFVKNFIMHIGKSVVFMLACLVIYSPSIAQDDIPTVNMMSPNAAALGKYVDYPVNMHTGVPQISIPIYTVSEGPLSLPISISYHASGLKVNENASWIGAGWSLNAGGVISRTVRGTPDEVAGSANGNRPRNGAGSLLRSGGFDSYYLTNNGSGQVADLKNFGDGLKDGEPDLFFFNFAGMSGEFYLDGRLGKRVIQIPEGDLKIELIKQQGTIDNFGKNYIQGFKVTNVDGTKYFFGRTSNPNDVDPIETSDVAVNGDAISYDGITSSWFLHKIESADGEFSIDLTYEQERYSYYSYAPNYCAGAVACSPYFNALKIGVQGVRLDNIAFSNGDVDFVENATSRDDLLGFNSNWAPTNNTEAYALKSIQITNNGGGFCQSFELTHDYFTSPPQFLPNTDAFVTNFRSIYSQVRDNKRLKLVSIQEKTCAGGTASVPAHLFEYYDETNVPRRFSFGVDHWGFSNGVFQDELAPDRGADRSSNEVAMKAGTLHKITYPTGGQAVFSLEANEATIFPDLTCSSPGAINVISVQAGFSSTSAELSPPKTLDVDGSRPNYLFCATVGGNVNGGHIRLNGEIIQNLSQGESFEKVYSLSPGLNTIEVYSGASGAMGNGVNLQIKEPGTTSVTETVGGLRVSKIEQTGTDATTIVTDYDYEEPNLYSIPTYSFKVKNEGLRTTINERYAYKGQEDRQNGGCMLQNAIAGYQRSVIHVVENIHPMIRVQGYHLGYGKVTRTQADGGYEIHYFDGQDGLPTHWTYLKDVKVTEVDNMICEEDYPEFPAIPRPFDYERGRLRKVEIYDANDRLLRETVHTESWEMADDALTAMKAEVVNVLAPWTFASFYELRSHRKKWSKEIARTFNPQDAAEYQEIETIRKFDSEYHRMVTSVETIVNGDSVERINRYPEDVVSCDIPNTCLSCWKTYQTALSDAFDQWQLDRESCLDDATRNCDSFRGSELDVTDASNCTAHCSNFAYKEYLYKIRDARAAYKNCRANDCAGLETCNSVPTDEAYQQMLGLIGKNQIALPIETLMKRDGNVVGAVFNEYAKDIDGDFYLDKIYRLSTSEPITDFEEFAMVTGNGEKDARYDVKPAGDLIFDEGNLVQKTTIDGITTAYLWGHNNTLPIVMAVGVSYQTLSSAYTADPVNFRQSNALSKALITTYEYDPVVGMTAMTGPNGIKVTYHYDELGRLQYVKDQDGNYLSENKYNYKD